MRQASFEPRSAYLALRWKASQRWAALPARRRLPFLNSVLYCADVIDQTACPRRHERRRGFECARPPAQATGLRRHRRDHEGLAAGLRLARRGQMLRPVGHRRCARCGPQARRPALRRGRSGSDSSSSSSTISPSEYQAGRTPNPCVMCNEKLKFGNLWSKAAALGADYIATGHYAIIEHHDGGRSPQGSRRSQGSVYFLFSLSRRQLSARSRRSDNDQARDPRDRARWA